MKLACLRRLREAIQMRKTKQAMIKTKHAKKKAEPQRRPDAGSERKGQGNWSKEERGSAKQAARSRDGTSQDEAREKEEAQQESEQEPISSSTTTHSTVRKLGMTSTRGLRSAVFGRRRRSSPWRDQLKPCEALD